MNFLKWYTLCLNVYVVLYVIIEIIAGNSTDVAGDLWAGVMWIPCIIYLTLNVLKKGE